ncbi:hypothetical protein H2248_002952 [Termitomyces sp. 'cryptogamus']|nr:hypothetical protein H2248_002952 [Termitomyces sp. 'cryptogamus']
MTEELAEWHSPENMALLNCSEHDVNPDLVQLEGVCMKCQQALLKPRKPEKIFHRPPTFAPSKAVPQNAPISKGKVKEIEGHDSDTEEDLESEDGSDTADEQEQDTENDQDVEDLDGSENNDEEQANSEQEDKGSEAEDEEEESQQQEVSSKSAEVSMPFLLSTEERN